MLFKKIEKILFLVFVFAIPFQTRIIFARWGFPFNEWLAGFVYATDILLLASVFLWFLRISLGTGRFFFSKADFFLIAFIFLAGLSVGNAELKGLAFFRLAKLLEFALLYFYVKANSGEMIKPPVLIKTIFYSGLAQALIAISQYLKQGSLGLKFLGESYLDLQISNVAVFFADGVKILRAYGTFPHTNVLAAWLLLACFAFYSLFFGSKWKNKFWPSFIFYPTILFGFFFTYSRTIIGLWFLVFLGLVFLCWFEKKATPIILLTIAVSIIFSLLCWPQVKARVHISPEEEAVTQRIFYNEIAGEMTQAKPWLGGGIGQFVANLKKSQKFYPNYFYQPVHNIYLLISSEVGILGLLTFLIFLMFRIKEILNDPSPRLRIKFGLLVFLGVFLVIGLLDHFLWTLQQGSLTLWLVLAVDSRWFA